jgi:hypothetical protein
MSSLKLNGEKLQHFSEALRDAFTVQRLKEMLRFRLDKRLDDYSLGEDYKEIVFELITSAEAEGWTAELVVAARQSNPGNSLLQALAEDVALAASAPKLERIVKAANPYLDVALFRQRLGEIETQVCRIEITTAAGTVFGTGFLVGPDVVMTNYHVMDVVISGKAKPTDAVFRFDYKRLSNAVISQGTTFSLTAADWLIDSSPTSPVDSKPEPKPGVPKPDELDYAIVRLEGSPGTKPAGAKPDPNAVPRGWIPVKKQADLANVPDLPPASPLLIMQHPDGTPLKLALDMSGVVGPNGNKTRVKYNVNTEGGSSGSPCFNAAWELVALHHSGDPNFDPEHKPEYNEGIPVSAILQLLTSRGKLTPRDDHYEIGARP